MNEIKGARRYCVKRVCRLGQGSRVQIGRLPLVFRRPFINLAPFFFQLKKKKKLLIMIRLSPGGRHNAMAADWTALVFDQPGAARPPGVFVDGQSL